MALEDLLDTIEGNLDARVDEKGRARAVKSLSKRLQAVYDDLVDFNMAYMGSDAMALDDLLGEVTFPDSTFDEAGTRKTLESAIISADLIGAAPETIERAKALLERLDEKPTPAAGKSRAIRGIGTPIDVACACGFTSVSKPGDWTSIRYQAKKHAESCELALPPKEEGEGYALDFDKARESIVTKREDIAVGGLAFHV